MAPVDIMRTRWRVVSTPSTTRTYVTTPPVGVVDGIEDHGARRRIGFSRGGGDDLDNAVKEGFDALTGLAGDLQDFVFVAAN